MNHEVRYHHVEGAIRKRELPSVTFFHFNPVVHALDLCVLQNGVRSITAVRITMPNINADYRTARQAVRRAEGQ